MSQAPADLRRGVVLDLRTIDRADLNLGPLQQALPHWSRYPHTSPAETAGRIRGAEVAVTNKVVLERALLRQAEALRLICIAATGTNNVDLDAARELGIAVTNVAGYSTPAVVQHLFAMILTLVTRLDHYRAAVGRGDWTRSEMFCLLDYPITELAGKTLGIVGYGALGRGVSRAAEGFGMRVLLAQRPGGAATPGRLPLRELLPQADILSLHCPLTAATRNLIGSAELRAMQPHALLLNTSRGGIVDEAALADALRTGAIAGAGIDVLAEEPPRPDSPLLAADIPNLILTPHSAWGSRESRQRLVHQVAENIRAFYRGESRNRVA